MSTVTPKNKNDASLLLNNAADLMGKRSVRATFRLSAEFIDVIRVLSAQLGIKQKSLFDHLMEDTDALHLIASRAQPGRLEKRGRLQKTVVISKKSLTSLDAIAREFSASRDDLVERSIQRLFPIVAEERRKQDRREAAFSKIGAHFTQMVELRDEIEGLVGSEDPMCRSIEKAFKAYKGAYAAIGEHVDKGKQITNLSMDKFRR